MNFQKSIITSDTPTTKPPTRVVINDVSTEIDCGRYPTKACLDDVISIQLNIFADGHDELAGNLLYKHQHEKKWHIKPLLPLGNDRWQGSFLTEQLGIYTYTFQAWVDEIATWAKKLLAKHEALQEIDNEVQLGKQYLQNFLKISHKKHKAILRTYLEALTHHEFHFLETSDFHNVIRCYPPKNNLLDYKKLTIWVDRKEARFAAWYEVFPRSLGKNNQHGTFRDLIEHLNYIADLGFDIVYLPPIHPIGEAARKGKNNCLTAKPGEPGSPWAIGGKAGGHMSIHPQLGTLTDFKALISAAKALNLEIAIDFAFQCSPDHPYLQTHPKWFKHNPDGSLQYAENPPKKYQDIYPFYFASTEWQSIWLEAEKIFLYWIEVGIKIFRVDNPHTKPFAFWEWLLKRMKEKHPEVIFLAEAFTELNTMYELSKRGFTQSYTYFTWKNSKRELTDYIKEITTPPVASYFRPNFWPNTPDLLHPSLHQQTLTAFMIRFILAATMSSSYGIYGPAFELGENQPVEAGSEEYLDSEKYEFKQWQLTANPLTDLIQKINKLRHSHAALQLTNNIKMLEVDNEQLLAYTKAHPNGSDWLFIIVNLDPAQKQSGTVSFKKDYFPKRSHYMFYDLLTEQIYEWNKWHNHVDLDPHVMPARILHIVREHF